MFTYGGLDNVHCESDIVYQPLSAALWWEFTMKSMSLGSYRSNASSYQVISDTGTSFIGGPSNVIKSIASQLGANVRLMQYLFCYNIAGCQKPVLLSGRGKIMNRLLSWIKRNF
ncbi:unnamed protein product [Anisakis simplex]|uniref:Peptidase A1 domain-containing protein n=1 Tax=Anisakis simplex TaxID=6269 RepID=A0A0M3JC45_ANISI|nr:unnamed protein product [Anisakis simplex]